MTARDEFAKSVIASGLMSAEDMQTYRQKIPAPQRPKDGETLGAVLVQNSRLTDYQKQELLAGRGKGLVLGNYVILDKLGQGGMWMVLKAEHKQMKRVVALKVLAPHVTKSPEALRRFPREVEAVAKLAHPNIVGAFDADEATGTHFLVMEYVDGRDLASIARSQGPLSPGDAVRCMLQAARGLEYAHGKGIVHRDIKPHNLMLDGQCTVKILDMGLARLESAGGEQDQLTGTGQIMGTVDFMAPEQAMDTRNADARADMYALGATLWYLIAGRPMYAGETMLQKLIAHQQAPIPSLCETRSDVTPALETAFKRMVAKTPDERYASMRELIADLERSLIDTSHAATMMFDGSTAGHSPQSLAMSVHSAAAGGATAAPAVSAPPVVAPASLHDATVDVSRPELDTHPKVEPAWSAPVVTPVSRRARSASPPPRSAKLMIGVGIGSVGLVAAVLVATLSLTGGDSRKDPKAVAKNTPNRPSTSPSIKVAKGPPPPLAIVPFSAAEAKRHQQAWADYLGEPVEKEIDLPGGLKLVMVLIPPGEFMREEGGKEYPVRLTKPFYMGKYEVTQEQWQAVMGSNPSANKESPKNPVEMVSWEDIQPILSKLRMSSVNSQWQFNLPSEAQWEFGCRAGTTTAWSFGASDGELPQYGWFNGNSGGKTHTVGQLKPNQFGLHDMHGNVWEWCLDWQEAGFYAKAVRDDPAGPPVGSLRVSRGGNWNSGAAVCRTASRDGIVPAGRGSL
jgi:serine/threonine-protein kinase